MENFCSFRMLCACDCGYGRLSRFLVASLASTALPSLPASVNQVLVDDQVSQTEELGN